MKLRIVDTAWGVNRRTGEKGERIVADVTFEDLAVGPLPAVGPESKVFTIEEIDENRIVVLLSERLNKKQAIQKGSGYFYRPMSFDAGNYYQFYLE